jgi:hypothetical protein
MRAALPALDAAAALIDPDGYLWMFGGNNGPGHSAAHPGARSVGKRPSPTSFLMRAALPALDSTCSTARAEGMHGAEDVHGACREAYAVDCCDNGVSDVNGT